jgi:hypothetical protein
MYQEIVNNMPKIVPNQATETELIPLKKGQSIENALFDVEDDVQINQVNPTPIGFRSFCLVTFSNHKVFS